MISNGPIKKLEELANRLIPEQDVPTYVHVDDDIDFILE